MPFMTRLPADLAAFGLAVETVPGWETRGSSSFAPGGVVCHWTAGPAGTTKRSSLKVVTDGRPGLSGPLCNVYLDRNGICVVVAAGRANHAGTGSWRGLVGNSAVYGIEAESAGPNDWTDAQRKAYPRLVAAMLHGLGRGAEWACGHSEWAGPRKTDINGYTTQQLRADVAAILANPNVEDPDMPLSDADVKRIRDAILFDTTDLRSGVAGDNAKPTNLASQVLFAAGRASQLPTAREVAVEVLERSLLVGPDGKPAMTRTLIQQAAAGPQVKFTIDASQVTAALLPEIQAAFDRLGASPTAAEIADELGKRIARSS